MINVQKSTDHLGETGTNRIVVHLNEGDKNDLATSSIEEAFSNIDIAYISPFFRTEKETKTSLSLTNQVILQLFPDQNIEQYQELFSQYWIKHTKMTPFGPHKKAPFAS